MVMKEIHNKILDYCRLKVANFTERKSGNFTAFTCPACGEIKANTIKYTDKIFCHNCNKTIGDIYDIVRIVEIDKFNSTFEEIKDYLIDLLNIPVPTETRIKKAFDFYFENGFDLVPLRSNGKIPYELDWTNKNHKNIEEWHEWLNNGLNIGVKTGLISNITVIDIDSQNIPDSINNFFKDYKGCVQKTNKGYHYFFKYDTDLRKTAFEFDGVHIDIENDGGQVVIFPSVIDGLMREFETFDEIPTINKELKDFIIKNIGVKKAQENTEEIDLSKFVDSPLENIKSVTEGNRNNFLIHFGGILRKELNLEQTRYVVDIVNKKFINPSLPQIEVNTIVGSLDKYLKFQEKDLAGKILNYLRIVGEATARDVKEVVNEKKEIVDKTLSFLIREGYIIKGHHGLYNIIRKLEWTDTLSHVDKPIDFKMPYFYDIANFNYGDMILLGSRSKVGKTTIAMNIIKDLSDQGKKPYYICLEAGSRFQKTWKALGGGEGQFFTPKSFECDPGKIELENNAITVLDWLMIENKAETDLVMQYFSKQLFKTNGILIVFMQLKETDEWFAPNMSKQFPALSARYVYTDENEGVYGAWIVDAIRDPKDKIKKTKIPCEYDWTTKRHKRVENI